MPGFSAIIYFFLGLQRSQKDEKLIQHLLSLKSGKDLIGILPEGLLMNQPIPIFTPIDDVEQFRKKFN